MRIAVYTDNQEIGPFELEAFRDLVRMGSIPSCAYARFEDSTEWVTVDEFVLRLPVEPMAATPARRSLVPPVPEPKTPPSLISSFAYPFKGNGWILLTTGTVFFGILDFASAFAGPAAILVAVFASGYMLSYLKSIILASAQGEEEMPAYPEFSSFSDDILTPFLQMMTPIVLCLMPGLFWFFRAVAALDHGGTVGAVVLPLVLVVVGALYLPMALLGVAMMDTVGGVNPVLVIPSILRIPGSYLAACFVLFLAVGGAMVFDILMGGLAKIPILPGALSGFVGLYLLAVEGRILGLIYLRNQRVLSWF